MRHLCCVLPLLFLVSFAAAEGPATRPIGPVRAMVDVPDHSRGALARTGGRFVIARHATASLDVFDNQGKLLYQITPTGGGRVDPETLAMAHDGTRVAGMVGTHLVIWEGEKVLTRTDTRGWLPHYVLNPRRYIRFHPSDKDVLYIQDDIVIELDPTEVRNACIWQVNIKDKKVVQTFDFKERNGTINELRVDERHDRLLAIAYYEAKKAPGVPRRDYTQGLRPDSDYRDDVVGLVYDRTGKLVARRKIPNPRVARAYDIQLTADGKSLLIAHTYGVHRFSLEDENKVELVIDQPKIIKGFPTHGALLPNDTGALYTAYGTLIHLSWKGPGSPIERTERARDLPGGRFDMDAQGKQVLVNCGKAFWLVDVDYTPPAGAEVTLLTGINANGFTFVGPGQSTLVWHDGRGKLERYDWRAGQALPPGQMAPTRVERWGISFSPDDQAAFLILGNSTGLLFETKTGRIIATLPVFESPASTWSADGRWLVVYDKTIVDLPHIKSAQTRSVRLIEAATGKVARQWEYPAARDVVAQLSPSAEYLAVTSYTADKRAARLTLLRRSTGATLVEVPAIAGFATAAFAGKPERLIVAGANTIVCLDCASGKTLWEKPVEMLPILWVVGARDAAAAVVQSPFGAVLFLDVNTGQVRTLGRGLGQAPAISADGKQVIFMSANNMADLVDTRTGARLARVSGRGYYVFVNGTTPVVLRQDVLDKAQNVTLRRFTLSETPPPAK